MKFTDGYVKQVALLVNIFSVISTDDDFALKGGSAINLFYQDLPRLSVDIDLAYLPLTPRKESIEKINKSLARIQESLLANGFQSVLVGPDDARKVFCSDGVATVKIEPNYTIRGSVLPVKSITVSKKVQETFGIAKMQVLDLDELYAGKICAALDRQHPRDLFDIWQMYESGVGLTDRMIQCLVVYLLSHGRPTHELLDCSIKDNLDLFEGEFAGMTECTVDYATLQNALQKLKADLLQRLLPYCDALVSFVELNPDFTALPFDNLDALPALKWKRMNLEKLRASNPAKFKHQAEILKQLFYR